MLFANSVDRQVNHLRRDAARVALDLSRLSQRIAHNGGDVPRLGRAMARRVRSRWDVVGERLDGALRGARETALVVHGRIRKTPIRYAAGALLAGLVLGTFVRRQG